MTKKKPKIDEKSLEEVLAKHPPEDREELRKILTDMFKDFDPANPPGKRVLNLPDGTTKCPACGSKLQHPHVTDVMGQLMEFVECDKCDQPYVRKALS